MRPLAHHNGYRRYKLVDNRVCPRCSARAGRCAHMAKDEPLVWLREPHWDHGDDVVLRRHAKSGWTAADEDTLRTLWRAGKSGGQIADLMNRGRVAVLSKARRLNLERRGSPARFESASAGRAAQ